MSFLLTGNACEALTDAVLAKLEADATLIDLVTGIYTSVPEAARTAHPYLVISGPTSTDGEFESMGVGGGNVTFALDGWSDENSPHPLHVILSRVRVLLEREPLTIPWFQLVGGSLHCTLSTVYADPADEDMPDRGLFHGHQEWEADLDEAA